MSSSKKKLEKFRVLLKEHSLDAYIIPSEDAHYSEYPPCNAKRRQFISGFTGSSGIAIVTLQSAFLWTDGRYHLQASEQLDPDCWVLMKEGCQSVPTIKQFLEQTFLSGCRVGYDPTTMSIARLLYEFKSEKFTLVPVKTNLVDQIWEDKPNLPLDPIVVHPLQFSGKSSKEKVKDIREELKKRGTDAFVVCAPDEIAWLFNLRGSDIKYCPVFIAYALVTMEEIVLYVDESKITPEVRDHLGSDVIIKSYNEIIGDIVSFCSKNHTILMDPVTTNVAIYQCVPSSRVIQYQSPIILPKALKNETELDGLRKCHMRDAVALITFLDWLEDKISSCDESIDEWTASKKLNELRSEQENFVSLSFASISAVDANAAIVHYKPKRKSAAKIKKNSLYLIDSGGQYRDGTTDVTRTIHLGEPSAHQKACFTRVLKGHINVATAVFRMGILGDQLDILARLSLWRVGLDYKHGTGHGVGSFLNVHEGPQGIHRKESFYKVPLMPGMTITDEPGYYENGNFGIRIESVLIVKNAQLDLKLSDQEFLTFENITFVPIQRKMLDLALLSQEEVNWINQYHRTCWEKLSPLLNGRSLGWLKRETEPLY